MLCAVCVRHFQAGRDLDPRAGARVVLEQPGGSRSYLSNGSSFEPHSPKGCPRPVVLHRSLEVTARLSRTRGRPGKPHSGYLHIAYGRVPVRVVLASSFWARDSSRPRPNASLALGARGARRRRASSAKEFATRPPQPHLRRAIQLDAGRRTHCWSCKRQRARPPRQGWGWRWGRAAPWGYFTHTHTHFSILS